MSDQELADPDQRPEADVVIWDGNCRYCRRQVERLDRFDTSNQLAYLSLHDPRVVERFPNLTHEQLMEQMWVVTPDNRQYGGADAGRYLSSKLRKLWWLRPLLHIPGSMPFWRWLYRMVAKSRYRISGERCDDQGTCHLHP